MSHISLINRTTELLHLALFQRPGPHHIRATVTWRVVTVWPHGSTAVDVSNRFELMASNLPGSQSYAGGGVWVHHRFAETVASFSIERATTQEHANEAVVRQYISGRELGRVHIYNNLDVAIHLHLLRDGHALFEPAVIPPGVRFAENIGAGLHVGVVPPSVGPGTELQPFPHLPSLEVQAGNALTVTGSQWRGYALAVD